MATGEVGVSYDENNLDKNAVISSRYYEKIGNNEIETKATIMCADGKYEDGFHYAKASYFEGSHQKTGVGGFNVDLLKFNVDYNNKKNDQKYGFGLSVFNFNGNVDVTDKLNLQGGITAGFVFGFDIHNNSTKKGISVDIILVHLGYDIYK